MKKKSNLNKSLLSDYTSITMLIENCAITFIPSILRTVIRRCYRDKIFVSFEVDLLNYVKTIIKECKGENNH